MAIATVYIFAWIQRSWMFSDPHFSLNGGFSLLIRNLGKWSSCEIYECVRKKKKDCVPFLRQSQDQRREERI